MAIHLLRKIQAEGPFEAPPDSDRVSVQPTLARTGARAALAPAPSSRREITEAQLRRDQRLRAIVDDHADFVARVLRNAGTPAADVDDDVQRAFIVVSRRLDDIHPGAEKSFLLRTALNLAAHARRTIARRREVAAEEAPESDNGQASPERMAEIRRHRVMLDDVLAQMETNLRTVFVLYEFEEMSMSEIASTLEIPPGTVASRLRRAREDFRARVKAIEGISGSEEKR
jgi:RNA polymerase sigma-70 factor (ECF subfamily)